MDPNGALDVVIGLVLMYLALSVMCTVVNEIIATLMALRAKSLAAGITTLIDNPNLRATFYNHGLIDGTRGVSAGGSTSSTTGHPSYISGDIFAMALLGSLDPTKPLPAFADIEGSIRHLPDCNIRDVMLAHVVASEKDMTTLRNSLASWFDQSMDRLGGSYKRKLKAISFGVGLVLAVGINADTVAVSRALWHDSALRDQMVKFAAHDVANATPPPGAGTNGSNLSAAFQGLRTAEEDVRPLPIGWKFAGTSAAATSLSMTDAVDALVKIAGLVLTALALTLGAPFWFDVLSKFINLRGAGVKPERTVNPTKVAASS